MIEIIDTKTNISCRFEGTITRTPSKRGHNEIMTNFGKIKTEKTRGVINLSISIDSMDEMNYSNLEKIFLSSNESLDIINYDRGVEYNGYFIQGETLSLDEKENNETKQYYYIGGITVYKR